jgi:hypothetical protein
LSRTRDQGHGYTFETREQDQRWRGSGERRERRTVGPGETPCPGGCNAAWRRQQKLLDAYAQTLRAWEENPSGAPPKEPETRPLSPLPGNPFCPADQAVYRRLLGEVDDLAAIAARYNDGHRKDPDAERVSGSRYARSPSATIEELDHIASALRDWEATARDLIRKQAGRAESDEGTPPRRGYLASEITTSVSWLVAHFDILITDADAAEAFAGEISEWHERLKRREKAGTGRRHMKVPCPRCDRYSLYQEDDAEYVACARQECGRLMSWPEFLTWSESFGKAGAA